jgi:hypothetical protein
MSMNKHTHVISYSDEHTEGIKKHQHVGCWVQTKPNWLNRLMARLLLGWKWEDRK